MSVARALARPPALATWHTEGARSRGRADFIFLFSFFLFLSCSVLPRAALCRALSRSVLTATHHDREVKMSSSTDSKIQLVDCKHAFLLFFLSSIFFFSDRVG